MLNEVIMAIDMREKSTIGCAYFTTEEGVIRISEDIPMANMDIAEQFLIHIQPTTLLISARAPEEFHVYLEKQCASSDEGTISPRLLLTTNKLY